MRHRKALSRLFVGSAAVGAAFLSACSGGGGSSPAQGGFQLVGISFQDGEPLEINAQIELTFNGDVSLASIDTGSTLQIRSIDGSGAPAFFSAAYKTDPATGLAVTDTIVIQPFCPLLGDFSDAGFQPGGILYELFVPGTDASPFTITSIAGAPLEITQRRTFVTPDSMLPAAVFEDTVLGPPAFVPFFPDDSPATFVRLGDGTEVPFAFNGSTHELDATDSLPLNLYSDTDSTVTYIVQLNQPVDPSANNLNDDRVRIEFLDGAGQWQAFQTLVELESNCKLGLPGAVLKLTPLGILPQDSQIRITIVAGFTDLKGLDSVDADQTDFFSPTAELDFASLAPADDGADELIENFLLSGEMAGSFEDTEATFDTPVASWENGALTSAFDFQGTGGPGGDFDWITPLGAINFSTVFEEITGGKDGDPLQTIPVVNGVIDINDMTVAAGTTLRVEPGGNPLTIVLTGDLRIDGIIDISGYDAKQVGTLFTPNFPEPGAAGCATGGMGGVGSFLTNASTPSGGIGDGPFGIANAGGQGGEAGHDPTSDKQKRRGAGGGGGRFAADVIGSTTPGLIVEQGDIGHPQGTGGISGMSPPIGGLPGFGPFLDGDPTNDFFGQAGEFLGPGGSLSGIIQGELVIPWAGYGGGAGGDAVQASTFPTIPFGPPYKDKKGAGAGGGGGQLRIICLGKVIFGLSGQILCDGGDGATGENVLGFDHIAGSSGGASGGHVIIESAEQIDFTDGGAANVPRIVISAVGGVGGIPKSTADQWSGGGNGGPGLIQYHVRESDPSIAVGTSLTSDIVIPSLPGTTLDSMSEPGGIVLVPNFGARSKARSRWIPLGAAAQIPSGGEGQVFFTFDGIESDDGSSDQGKILTTNEMPTAVAPILPDPVLAPEVLGTAAPDPFVDASGFTLVLSQPSVQVLIDDAGTPSDDIYLRNPALLKNFILRLQGSTNTKDFDIVSAAYDDAAVSLTLTVDPAGGSLEAFVTGQGGPSSVDYEVRPRYFRVKTGLAQDSLPDTGFVKILFQATTAGTDGQPDGDNPVVDWTADPTKFNTVPAGDLDFFRFEVEFNLDASGGGGLTVNTEPISLEFLRLPFGF